MVKVSAGWVQPVISNLSESVNSIKDFANMVSLLNNQVLYLEMCYSKSTLLSFLKIVVFFGD